MMTTRSYTVTGMTCSHCVASVSEDVGDIPGVEEVEVSLDTGALTVVSAEPVDDSAVRSAVEAAGYRVA